MVWTRESSWLNLDNLQGDHSACAKPPIDFNTKVPLWLGLAWPGQSGTFVLKSTGGFAQAEWSPCINLAKQDAGLGRNVNQEKEEISPHHVQTFSGASVFLFTCRKDSSS